MQTARIVQAVALMMIVALAASCSASKQYTSKLFAPRTEAGKDSQAVVLKFLDMDESEMNPEAWVSTDIIMGRDTLNKTTALDNFAKSFPATAPKIKADTIAVAKETKPVMAEVKTTPATEDPIAKTTSTGAIRSKRSREE
ncbi:MAG: hypothetical protein ACT4OJ_02510 [Bacteroidota bacterium]